MKASKLLTVLLSVAVMVTMTGMLSFADDGTTSSSNSKYQYVDEVVDAETEETMSISTTVSTDLKMLIGSAQGQKADATVVIDRFNGTADVTFTTTPHPNVKYDRIALLPQTASKKKKDAAAFNGDIISVGDEYATTFKITIPVSKLGKEIPISLSYEKYYSKSHGTYVEGWHEYNEQHYLTVNYSPSVVAGLTSAIYYPSKETGTDALCKAAKEGWDSLSEEEQKNIPKFSYYSSSNSIKGGYEFFGEDTGDASKEDTLNSNKIGKYEILVGSFGTSYNDSRILSIGAVEKAIQKAYPKFSVRRGFTSQIIINHIQARDGKAIDNIDEACQRAVKNNVQYLVVQSTTLMSGSEYDELKTTVNKYSKKFKKVAFAQPLCSSDADKEAVAKVVYADAAKKANFSSTEDAVASTDTAFVLMGHGTSHEAQVLYTDMQDAVTSLGYKNCFIGTVEGKPETTSLENTIQKVKDAGYTKVILRPLMVVAGDHAKNDMAEEWSDAFEAAGIEATSQIYGLGELSDIQDIYVQHTKAAIKSAGIKTTSSGFTTTTAKKAVKKAPSIKSVRAGKKKAIVKIKKKSKVSGYQIRYSTKKSFKHAKTIKTTKTTRTIKNLKKGKKYYFKVRSYAKTSKKTYYSKWSKTKKSSKIR
ncbi:MAG: sirohydrochlorin cobaltochelatase [Anaerovoracaceae bacterium]|jgi:sirohydrochlorin cobaltochelatase